jgi:hypothetical protein
MSQSPRKKILVVGAGAAGMSCAEQLSHHPDKFDVTVIEAQGYCGGQAFSIPIDETKYGANWMNQGVQGWVTPGSRMPTLGVSSCYTLARTERSFGTEVRSYTTTPFIISSSKGLKRNRSIYRYRLVKERTWVPPKATTPQCQFRPNTHHPGMRAFSAPFLYVPQFWTNVFPTHLVQKHQSEIKRFNWAVKVMRWFEVLFAVIPIKISLKIFFFSEE